LDKKYYGWKVFNRKKIPLYYFWRCKESSGQGNYHTFKFYNFTGNLMCYFRFDVVGAVGAAVLAAEMAASGVS